MRNFKGILKSVLFAYGIAIVLLVIFAVIYTYSNLPESAVMPVVTVITIISATLCGIRCARGRESRGFMYGGIGGLAYAVLLTVIASLAFDNYSFSGGFVTLLLLSVFCGMLGGMLGINYKNKRRKERRR